MADDKLILNVTEKLSRVILDSSQRIIPLIDETYSILLEVRSILQYMRKPETFLEPDDTVPICEGSTHTKGKWPRECFSICNKFILPQESQQDLLNLIFKTFGQTADLPVALTTHKKKSFKRKLGAANNDEEEDTSSDDNSISAHITMSKVKDYIRKTSRWIKLNQYQNSCCVFVGKLHNAFGSQNVEGEDIKNVYGMIAKERGRKTIVITYTWTMSQIPVMKQFQ